MRTRGSGGEGCFCRYLHSSIQWTEKLCLGTALPKVGALVFAPAMGKTLPSTSSRALALTYGTLTA